MGIDPGLLDKLVCPKCKGPLKVHGESEGLDCGACLVRYPVQKFGEDVYVPDMIIEHAKSLTGEEDGGA